MVEYKLKDRLRAGVSLEDKIVDVVNQKWLSRFEFWTKNYAKIRYQDFGQYPIGYIDGIKKTKELGVKELLIDTGIDFDITNPYKMTPLSEDRKGFVTIRQKTQTKYRATAENQVIRLLKRLIVMQITTKENGKPYTTKDYEQVINNGNKFCIQYMMDIIANPKARHSENISKTTQYFIGFSNIIKCECSTHL